MDAIRHKPSSYALSFCGFKIFQIVFFYFTVSISLVFLNKYLMIGSFDPVPLFMTWFQMIIALICIGILGEIGKRYPNISDVPPLEFRPNIAKKVFPVTFVFIGMVAFNNLCLRYVQVSFYQVCRSLTIVFTLILTYFVLGKRTSSRSIIACMVVVVGFAMGAIGEADFSWLGLIYGVLSSFFVGLNSIVVRQAMTELNDNHWRMAIYSNALSIVFMYPLVWLTGEMDVLRTSPMTRRPYFWFVMVVTGVFGFLINIATNLQIKNTSPLTHTISGTAKACIQTVLAVLIWQNTITPLNLLGIVLVIGGSFWYSYIRFLEMAH